MSKAEIRAQVWATMDRRGVSRFPKPIQGRIPNFVGADAAAERLCCTREFMQASVVKVNPDSPQRKVREIALRLGKTVLMPSPRLSKGFIILEPGKIKISYVAASTIRKAFTCGRLVSLRELPDIDMIVCGSVAVSPRDGARLGKGEGYSEIEFAVLTELGLVRESTPIATSVHSTQLVSNLPVEPFDLHVDLIATETELIRVKRDLPRPKGIDWGILGPRLEEMPILKELKAMSGSKG